MATTHDLSRDFDNILEGAEIDLWNCDPMRQALAENCGDYEATLREGLV